MTIKRIDLQVSDYDYFKETCLDAYNLTEVSRTAFEVTIEGHNDEILSYLNFEYCAGMDDEMLQDIIDSIY